MLAVLALNTCYEMATATSLEVITLAGVIKDFKDDVNCIWKGDLNISLLVCLKLG